MGGYLDVKVSVFQIQRKEPVPWAFHEGAVQVPEIEDGSEATILFGDEEVAAVEAWLALSWWDQLYGPLCQ